MMSDPEKPMTRYLLALNALELGFVMGVLMDRRGEPLADGLAERIHGMAARIRAEGAGK